MKDDAVEVLYDSSITGNEGNVSNPFSTMHFKKCTSHMEGLLDCTVQFIGLFCTHDGAKAKQIF